MGLDIDVYKPVHLSYEQIKDYNDPETPYRGFSVYNDIESPDLVALFPEFVFDMDYDLIDWEKALGGSTDDYEFLGSEYGEHSIHRCKSKETGQEFEIIDPPTKKTTVKSIAFESVGYQRKGANCAFYDDEIWGTIVVDSKTLLEHWDKYFSGDTTTGPSRCFEYQKTADENKSSFKRNIIDKFVEGETFVIYH